MSFYLIMSSVWLLFAISSLVQHQFAEAVGCLSISITLACTDRIIAAIREKK